MNQIKKARNLKKISQKELAEKLKVTQQAVSYYENNARVPDEKTWEEMSNILKVPPEYLKGEIDDPDGWELWEERTGFTTKEIKQEIERMKNANHIFGDIFDLQNLIKQAIDNLSGYGNTDEGIIFSISSSITTLQQQLDKKYKDPEKIKKITDKSNLEIIPANTNISDLIYDDLNPEVYLKAKKILHKTSVELRNLIK